jgi:1-acyl-sn-glycerol-3-phosphate acyltransferase
MPAGMRALRAVWRLALLSLHVLLGLVIVVAAFPRMDLAARRRTLAWWARRQLRVLGIGLAVEGSWRSGATLILANHVSWLDIAAIHAVCPRARFVSKADVHHWPVIGRLTGAADTLFIEREKKRDALRVVHQMAERLRQGDAIAVFPEGTTGTGHALLPFHANLLQAAISAEAPVQPVALRYADASHAVSEAVTFVGETTLVQSLWRVACGSGIHVRLRVLPPMGTAHADRRALTEHVRDTLAGVLAEWDAQDQASPSRPRQ